MSSDQQKWVEMAKGFQKGLWSHTCQARAQALHGGSLPWSCSSEKLSVVYDF